MRTRLGHTNRRRYAIGENPPEGAIIDYWLKEEPKEPAKLELLDSQERVIRSFNSEKKKTTEAPPEEERDEEAEYIPAAAGMNRFVWNLRHESPVKIPAAIYDGNNGPTGPLALPGKYSVRLTVAGKSYTEPLQITMDPRVKTSAADLQKQFDFLLKLRDRQDELNHAILNLRDLRTQLVALEKRLGKGENKSLANSSSDLRKRLGPLEDQFIQVNATASEDEANYPTMLNSKLSYLNAVSDSADTAPTPAEEAVFDKLSKDLDAQLATWREIQAKDVRALNETLVKASIMPVGVGESGKR